MVSFVLAPLGIITVVVSYKQMGNRQNVYTISKFLVDMLKPHEVVEPGLSCG